MIHVFEKLIPDSLCAKVVKRLEKAEFVDGIGTAGQLDAELKQNLQLPLRDPVAREFSGDLVGSLSQSPEFVSAVRLKRMIPPRVNRYDEGMYYAEHLDRVVMLPGQDNPLRTDISLTICLNSASDYEGGELVINANGAEHRFRGNAGDVIVYPSGYVHEVTPVERGTRLVAVSWIQSQIRDAGQRDLAYKLDCSIAALEQAGVERKRILELKEVHGALLRRWLDI